MAVGGLSEGVALARPASRSCCLSNAVFSLKADDVFATTPFGIDPVSDWAAASFAPSPPSPSNRLFPSIRSSSCADVVPAVNLVCRETAAIADASCSELSAADAAGDVGDRRGGDVNVDPGVLEPLLSTRLNSLSLFPNLL